MKDRVILFETAKMAIDIGFDIPINRLTGMQYYNYKGELNGNCMMSIKHRNDKNYQNIPAPTQSLLQKWLREKYNVEVYVHPYFEHCKCQYDSHRQLGYGGTIITAWKKEPDCKFVTITEFLIFPQDILDDDETIEKDFHKPIFKTYEDALEYELQAAIEHIKRRYEK